MVRGSALVFAADERFALALGVAVHSAVRHLGRDCSPELFVLDAGLAGASRTRLRTAVGKVRPDIELTFVRVPDERLADLPVTHAFSVANYARLLIPELLPEHVERAVYLDVDVLVRSDLSPLFAVDLRGSAVGAVRDAAITSTVHEMSGVRERTEARPYFNAGVLVMDVPAWRRENVGERALRYVVAGRPLKWSDQDSLNGVVEHMHELDARWNTQHSNFLPRNRHRSAAVWHFIGGKPWNPRSETPGTYAWVWNLARSGWFSRVEAVKWVLFWLGARGWLNRAGEMRWPRLANVVRRLIRRR